MADIFEFLAAFITLTATFAWINNRIFHLPSNIGMLMIGMVSSLLLIGTGWLWPGAHIKDIASLLGQIDFHDIVMHGMLAFLLFSAALRVDGSRLQKRALVIGSLATLGVLISMIIVATGAWAVARLAGQPLSFAWALVFGALIAPTDPVAVTSTLKAVAVSETLQTDMSGEALFNDGFGVVLFVAMLQIAQGGSGTGPGDIGGAVLLESVGGGLLGLATGYIAYQALRRLDAYSIEVLVSLALAMATFALAGRLHVSAPIAVAVAGVLTGNHSAGLAMSDRTRRYMFGFWLLIDDILNAVLFLLIGIEVLVVKFDPAILPVGLLAIPLVVLARFVSVATAVLTLRRWCTFARGTIAVLTWGGARGGISIALALAVPAVAARPAILAATYCVVLFTVIVQGLTLSFVARRTAESATGESPTFSP